MIKTTAMHGPHLSADALLRVARITWLFQVVIEPDEIE